MVLTLARLPSSCVWATSLSSCPGQLCRSLRALRSKGQDTSLDYHWQGILQGCLHFAHLRSRGTDGPCSSGSFQSLSSSKQPWEVETMSPSRAMGRCVLPSNDKRFRVSQLRIHTREAILPPAQHLPGVLCVVLKEPGRQGERM